MKDGDALTEHLAEIPFFMNRVPTNFDPISFVVSSER